MTLDSPAELPQPVPVPPASIADPPMRLARLRREFAELYAGLDAGTCTRLRASPTISAPGSPAIPTGVGAPRRSAGWTRRTSSSAGARPASRPGSRAHPPMSGRRPAAATGAL